MVVVAVALGVVTVESLEFCPALHSVDLASLDIMTI